MESSRIVLDTSAYAQFRRGHSELVLRMSRASTICVPTIVIGELAAGFALGSRAADNEATLDRFLSEPFVEVRGVDLAAGQQYGRLFAALRRAGTPIPTNDIWIAAVTVVAAGHLLTFDRDFSRIAGLTCTVLSADAPQRS